MPTNLLRALILLSALLCACTVQVGAKDQNQVANAGTEAQEKEVRAAAKSVAALLDAGRYDDIWNQAGPILVAKTSKQEFSDYVLALRRPLGVAGSRKIKGFGFPSRLEGAPPGTYGLIAVDTDFANAKHVEEKFVFQQIDGQWKLIGYWLSKKFTFGTSGMSNNSFKPNLLRYIKSVA